MQLNSFKGYINHKNEICAFSFDKNILTIFPYNIEEWNKIRDNYFFQLSVKNVEKKWLKNIILEGIIDELRGVMFFVTDNPSIERGFYSYSVDYVYIYKFKDKNNAEKEQYDIFGLKFKNQEINSFYNSSNYINEELKLKENNSFDKFNFQIKSINDEDFGFFKWHNYSVKIKGSLSFNRNRKSSNVIEINSIIILELSRKCNSIEKIIDLIKIQKIFLEFCCYRENINFDEIETFTYTNKKLKQKVGNFYVIHEELKDNNLKIIEQMIDSKEMFTSISKIYEMINKNQIYTTHFCQSGTNRKIYSSVRILSVLIAFENSYEKIYKNLVFSEEYLIAKGDIVNCVQEKISKSSGKIKEKYKKLKNSISKLKEGYSEQVKYALTDNYNILKPFIEKIYQVKHAKPIVSSCANRVSEIRNSMAHGTLDIKFKPIHSNDVKLIEILIYSMILKYVGLEDKIIQEKLKKLFNIIF